MQTIYWMYICHTDLVRNPGRQDILVGQRVVGMTEKKYILQNTDSKWVTIVSIDDLSYTNYQNMIEYKSKYYILKASIKEQSITIEVVFKI